MSNGGRRVYDPVAAAANPVMVGDRVLTVGGQPIQQNSSGGKGGASVQRDPVDFVGPIPPAESVTEFAPYLDDFVGPIPTQNDFNTGGGGKGGVETPAAPVAPPNVYYAPQASQPQMFDNTGRLVDSTLLAQQAILGRQPTQYQPLITPESYQNFYNMPATSYGSNAPLAPDYRTLAQKYRDDAAAAAAAAAEDAGGDGVDAGDGGYDPNAAVNLAPVTVIDVNTGQVVSVDPGGTTASGMPGSTLGVGTVSDDPTGPESEDGNGNIGVSVSPVSGAASVPGTDLGLLGTVGDTSNTGVTVSPVADQATVTGVDLGFMGPPAPAGVAVSPVSAPATVTGTDLGLLGGVGNPADAGFVGPAAPAGLSNFGTAAPDVSANYGGGGGVSGAEGGFAPGVSGDTFGGEGDSADGGGGGGGDGGCVIATHAVSNGSFSKADKMRAVKWCTANLHDRWWGEAFRRGYRYHGNKAINAGTASQHYDEFKDFVRFATGQKRTFSTAKTFVWRSVQFFVTGLFLKS